MSSEAALRALTQTKEALVVAREHAAAAAAELDEGTARRTRATELVSFICDCICHLDRLNFVILGDYSDHALLDTCG